LGGLQIRFKAAFLGADFNRPDGGHQNPLQRRPCPLELQVGETLLENIVEIGRTSFDQSRLSRSSASATSC